MLSQISEILVQFLDKVGVVGIFFATVIESFFAPIPSEIVLFTAGYYASGHGGIPMLIIFCVVASFGNYIGTLPFYLISYYSSEKYLPRFLDKFGAYLLISNKDLEKTQKYFDQRGGITVFFARLIPGVRSLIAFPAGLAKMNFYKYTIFTLLGSFVWNLFLGAIGYWAFDQKEIFFEIFDPISNLVLLAVGIGILIYVIKVVLNVRKIKRENASK